MTDESQFGLIPAQPNRPTKAENSSERESVFRGFRLGTVREDFEIRAPGDELVLASGILDNGRIMYYDSSFASLMDLDIETQDTLHTGEKLVVLPTDIAPGGPGRVCVIPYSWHLKELEKYVQTGKQPKGLIFVAVPENLIVEIDPNSLEAESRS